MVQMGVDQFFQGGTIYFSCKRGGPNISKGDRFFSENIGPPGSFFSEIFGLRIEHKF